MVQSEEDLDTALQVSNALTRAILDYKMKTLAAEEEVSHVSLSSFSHVYLLGVSLANYFMSTWQ